VKQAFLDEPQRHHIFTSTVLESPISINFNKCLLFSRKTVPGHDYSGTNQKYNTNYRVVYYELGTL